MLRIRLSRRGKRNNPFYRIVVTEAGVKNNGKPLATVGHWHPKSKAFSLDLQKVKEYVSRGASISDSVRQLMPKGNKNE